jgi:hypothetical protein
MNAAALPAGHLACMLYDGASGMCADVAAVMLTGRHGHFLHDPAFRRIIAAGSPVTTGEPAAGIRWKAAIHALDSGRMPCSGSEQAILRIAASLAGPAITVRLRENLGNLDHRNIALVTDAITAANG